MWGSLTRRVIQIRSNEASKKVVVMSVPELPTRSAVLHITYVLRTCVK